MALSEDQVTWYRQVYAKSDEILLEQLGGSPTQVKLLADRLVRRNAEVTGTTVVFKAGPKFELLASNSLGDACSPYCLSTVAVSEGQLFIRSSANLWAIGQRKTK